MADVGVTTCTPVVGMIRGEGRTDVETVGKKRPIAKDCLLTLVKSRLALGSPGCVGVWVFLCHHPEHGLIHRKWLLTAPS